MTSSFFPPSLPPPEDFAPFGFLVFAPSGAGPFAFASGFDAGLASGFFSFSLIRFRS